MNLTDKELALRLHYAGVCRRGLSLSWQGKEPSTGYAVGTRDNELRLHFNANVRSIVQAWVSGVGKRYANSGVQYVLGVWCDGEHVYYDVSRIIADRNQALEFGRGYGQLAIWDIVAGTEIRL